MHITVSFVPALNDTTESYPMSLLLNLLAASGFDGGLFSPTSSPSRPTCARSKAPITGPLRVRFEIRSDLATLPTRQAWRCTRPPRSANIASADE